MAIDDKIGKWDAFKQIVRQEHCQGKYAGDVPNLKIPAEKVDEIYLIVKKMQRCYHDQPEYAVSKYYAMSFSLIEDAYLSRDFEAFKGAVRGLMFDIDAE
ncbi:MAG: hypothetical protein ABIB71_07130 [Candidatus Woesearchaeota archaeon]